MTRPLASDALVERIAAAFHTLVRGWYFDPAGDAQARAAGDEIRLDPWVVRTDDPHWLGRDENTVDLAATWWEDLPADWRERFVGLAREAANAVVAAAQLGTTPIDMVEDDIFLARLGLQLQRDWLDPPRVIALEGGVVDGDRGEVVLACVAILVYAHQLNGRVGTLGTVPALLPSQLPDPEQMIKVGGPRPRDRKYVSFGLRGDRLSVADRARLTELIGYEPDASFSRGALHLQRTTGKQYRPRQSGFWSLSTDAHVLRRGPTLEDHVLWLLAVLEPHRIELAGLIAERDLTARFGCYYSQTGLNAEWELSARTIERIAALGASFWFDSYRNDDDEPEDDAGSIRWPARDEDSDRHAHLAHLNEVKPSLPPAVSAVSEINLHDALIERLTINEAKRTITVRLVIGDLQRGYHRARIKYRDAKLTALGAELHWLVEYEATELRSSEIETTEHGFEHRLRFWPAGEIHIAFSDVDVDLQDLPDRTRRGPKLRWR